MKKKKYIISESQFKFLVEKKKQEKVKYITNRIVEDIEKSKKNLNESTMLNEAIVDTLKKYFRKGLLTTAVIASLLANNNVQAQDLVAAGVPQDKIEQATGDEETGKITSDKIEKKLLNTLNRRGEIGIVKQYQNLPIEQKNNVLNVISQKINKLSDINNLDIQISKWVGKELGPTFDKIGEQRQINVDSIFVDLVKNYETDFEFNSAELKNAESTKNSLQELLNSFVTVDSISIVASSSALRNTGDFEGMTWIEGSQVRAGVIKNLLVGMNYNLGGCGANKSNTISENEINIDVSGENGDGTSGPKSPFEISEKSIEWYNQQGIPENLWQSAAEDAPYDNVDSYKQHQFVKVVIFGEVVETETNEIVNFRFLKVKEKEGKFKIEKSKTGKGTQNRKVLSCPIK